MPADRHQHQLPLQQLSLCCPCGSQSLYRRGLCEICYNSGRPIDRGVPDLLVQLWAEQHPRSPRQLQLPADLLG